MFAYNMYRVSLKVVMLQKKRENIDQKPKNNNILEFITVNGGAVTLAFPIWQRNPCQSACDTRLHGVRLIVVEDVHEEVQKGFEQLDLVVEEIDTTWTDQLDQHSACLSAAHTTGIHQSKLLVPDIEPCPRYIYIDTTFATAAPVVLPSPPPPPLFISSIFLRGVRRVFSHQWKTSPCL